MHYIILIIISRNNFFTNISHHKISGISKYPLTDCHTSSVGLKLVISPSTKGPVRGEDMHTYSSGVASQTMLRFTSSTIESRAQMFS